MQNGTVKWFNTEKGYGFITPEVGGKDVFVHITALQSSGIKELADGQQISFETSEDGKGKVSAVNLQI